MKLSTTKQNSALLGLAIGLGLAGCEHDCDSCGHDVPAAPHDLEAELYKSGIHLVWEDASDDEDNFVVERWVRASAALQYNGLGDLSAKRMPPSMVQAFGVHFIELVELPENTEDYLDTDVDSGLTYVYRIRAVNTAGSSISDELEVVVP